MAAIDFIVSEEMILVEWEREMLPEKPTRLVDIRPGDKLAVKDLYGANVVVVDEIKDWQKPEDGCTWFVYYRPDGHAEQRICNARVLVEKWHGVWL